MNTTVLAAEIAARHVPNSIHVASNLANFRGSQRVYFPCLCSEYPLVQFLSVRHSFLTGQVLSYKKQKNDRKQSIRFAICDLHDELNFPPNTARSKVDLG